MPFRLLFLRIKRWLVWFFVCRRRGHDFGNVIYCSPAVLTFCRRCRRELQGRTWEDLEPATDEDREIIEHLIEMDSYDA